MMDFISVPLVVGIVCAGIYGLFELFVRKRERLAIIEKIGDKLDASAFDGKLGLPNYMRNFSFSSLKAGCLLAGIGLGLLVGFIINMCMATNSYYDDGWYRHEVAGTAYGASVLLFGGIGLIIAFVIELKLGKNNNRLACIDVACCMQHATSILQVDLPEEFRTMEIRLGKVDRTPTYEMRIHCLIGAFIEVP